MTGITRQRAAEVVAEMFGTEAYYDGTTYGAVSYTHLELEGEIDLEQETKAEEPTEW